MAKQIKFQTARATVAALEAVVNDLSKFKPNPSVTSGNSVPDQVVALQVMLHETGLDSIVSAQRGTWFTTTPLVNVVLYFGLDYTESVAMNGRDASELSQLMIQGYRAFQKIVSRLLPAVKQYTPEYGVVAGGWRFQQNS